MKFFFRIQMDTSMPSSHNNFKASIKGFKYTLISLSGCSSLEIILYNLTNNEGEKL